MEIRYAQALDRRQGYGTDWVTETVRVTLPPGQSASAPAPTAPSTGGGTLTRTIYITQLTATETVVAPSPSPTQPIPTTSPVTATEYLSLGTLTVTETTQPSPVTYYPPTATCYENCSTRTVTSRIRAATPAAVQQSRPTRPCAPGDAGEKAGGGPLSPTKTQAITLYIVGVYFVSILAAWNFFGLRTLLYPVKIVVVAWHEFGHAVAAVASGSRLSSVRIDPNEGGLIQIEGAGYPVAALPAGFVFSILIGGLLTFAGFNTLASKIASFFLGLSLLAVIWWAAGAATKILIAGALGLMIGFWFIDHGSALRYYILFYGVASSFYVIWDTIDDLVFRKVHPCCARLWYLANPRVPTHIWLLAWFGVSFVVFVLFIIAALAAFRETPHGMYCQSQQFLPT